MHTKTTSTVLLSIFFILSGTKKTPEPVAISMTTSYGEEQKNNYDKAMKDIPPTKTINLSCPFETEKSDEIENPHHILNKNRCDIIF